MIRTKRSAVIGINPHTYALMIAVGVVGLFARVASLSAHQERVATSSSSTQYIMSPHMRLDLLEINICLCEPFLSSVQTPMPIPSSSSSRVHQYRRSNRRRGSNSVAGGDGCTRSDGLLHVAKPKISTGDNREGRVLTVKYLECRKNHAAWIGGHAVDGCGEFMAIGEEGEHALRCAACGCHRSFHKREVA